MNKLTFKEWKERIEIKELIYKLDDSLVEKFGEKNKDRNMKSILELRYQEYLLNKDFI